MDSRHETIDQEVLNRFICYINKYLQDNIDEILIKQWLINDIKEIALYIYSYANMEVELSEILTKKNLLSLDMVALPCIEDTSLGRLENKNAAFRHIINNINAIISKRNNIDLGEHNFYLAIQEILSDYDFQS